MANNTVDNQNADVYNMNLQISGVFIIVAASISYHRPVPVLSLRLDQV